MPVPHLATLLGLPPATCTNLLLGRPRRDRPTGRRPLPRISPMVAERLLSHDADSLRDDLAKWRSATTTRQALTGLVAQGHPVTTLATVTGIGTAGLAALLSGRVTTCSGRTALAARAAVVWAEGQPTPTPQPHPAAVVSLPRAA
ncbi:hypothetical protein ACQBAU_06075 [Propionibacteriaceae bacterium Y2011]|uniref:hypothetical protein n=1 Tax=Microlunatus sp. Y2014 TaxID=3418488 RepID=UPI003B4CAA70